MRDRYVLASYRTNLDSNRQSPTPSLRRKKDSEPNKKHTSSKRLFKLLQAQQATEKNRRYNNIDRARTKKSSSKQHLKEGNIIGDATSCSQMSAVLAVTTLHK